MYYIYHVKGKKIGVSTNPELRTKRQGFTKYEILETHTCIDTVSVRELELQKQYGYRIDDTPYKQTHNTTKKHKLTKEQQLFIKNHCYTAQNQFTKIPEGKFTMVQLAKMFNVSQKNILDARKRSI